MTQSERILSRSFSFQKDSVNEMNPAIFYRKWSIILEIKKRKNSSEDERDVYHTRTKKAHE